MIQARFKGPPGPGCGLSFPPWVLGVPRPLGSCASAGPRMDDPEHVSLRPAVGAGLSSQEPEAAEVRCGREVPSPLTCPAPCRGDHGAPGVGTAVLCANPSHGWGFSSASFQKHLSSPQQEGPLPPPPDHPERSSSPPPTATGSLCTTGQWSPRGPPRPPVRVVRLGAPPCGDSQGLRGAVGGCRPQAPCSPHAHVRLVLLPVQDPQQRRVLVPPEVQCDVVDGCDCGGAGVSAAAPLGTRRPLREPLSASGACGPACAFQSAPRPPPICAVCPPRLPAS